MAAGIIDKLLTYSKLNAKSFSEKIGLDRPQAIYDIQKGKTKCISPAMANKITSVFPEVNKAWLLTGEGDMLRATNTQTGSENNNQQGQNINYNSSDTLDKALNEIGEQRKLVAKAQEQIDRLLSIVEKMQK